MAVGDGATSTPAPAGDLGVADEPATVQAPDVDVVPAGGDVTGAADQALSETVEPAAAALPELPDTGVDASVQVSVPETADVSVDVSGGSAAIDAELQAPGNAAHVDLEADVNLAADSDAPALEVRAEGGALGSEGATAARVTPRQPTAKPEPAPSVPTGAVPFASAGEPQGPAAVPTAARTPDAAPALDRAAGAPQPAAREPAAPRAPRTAPDLATGTPPGHMAPPATDPVGATSAPRGPAPATSLGSASGSAGGAGQPTLALLIGLLALALGFPRRRIRALPDSIRPPPVLALAPRPG